MFRFGSEDEEDDDTIIRSVQPLPKKAVDRSVLMAPDFDPDQFLSSRRHLGLEQLKTELNAHLVFLNTELVELINRDYQDFINLSTNLNHIDQHIDGCQEPLTRLKDQALDLRAYFQDEIEQLQQELDRRSKVKKQKDSVNLLLNIHESITKVENLLKMNDNSSSRHGKIIQGDTRLGKHIERVAVEYNQMQHLVSRGRSMSSVFVTENKLRIQRIKDTLESRLSKALLEAIQQLKADGECRNARQTAAQCLRTFALIDMSSAAESLIRREFVRPSLTQMMLSRSKSTQSFKNMYDKILVYAAKDLQPLRDITQRDLKGTNYDVLANVLWAEVVERINQDYSSMFAAGDANLFHKNYATSMAFVSGLEALCTSKKTLLSLRTHSSYVEFMKRWQLPVYFKLRFREIVNDLEELLTNPKSLAVPDTNSAGNNTDGLWLPSSKALSASIDYCWSDNVFLYSLSHEFWKLTLQLIQRYDVWASDAMGTLIATARSEEPNTSPTSQRPVEETTAVRQLMFLAHDSCQFITWMKEKWESTITTKLPTSVQGLSLLQECMDSALQQLNTTTTSQLDQKVADLLSQRCFDTLKQVRRITNQYRHTNKPPPTEPSHFIPNVFKPFLAEVGQNPGLVSSSRRATWGAIVGDMVIQRYTDIATDFLTSLKKMEDAMEAKKNKTSAPNHGDTKDGLTDEDKMRLQFVFDARQLGNELARLGVEKTSLDSYQKLMTVVQPFEHIEALARNKPQSKP